MLALAKYEVLVRSGLPTNLERQGEGIKPGWNIQAHLVLEDAAHFRLFELLEMFIKEWALVHVVSQTEQHCIVRHSIPRDKVAFVLRRK